MGFTCGIVGLPNVGKSALFNALTETAAAQATKYPFSTNEAQEARETLDLVQRALMLLRDGKPARLLQRSNEEEKAFRMLALLTAIPVLYVGNVNEASAATGDALSQKIEERAKAEGAGCV